MDNERLDAEVRRCWEVFRQMSDTPSPFTPDPDEERRTRVARGTLRLLIATGKIDGKLVAE